MIISSLLIILLGGVSAADNTPHDAIMNISSGNPLDDSFNGEDVNESVQEYDAKHDNENPPFAEDIENQSVNSSNNSFSKIKVPHIIVLIYLLIPFLYKIFFVINVI